MRPQVANGFVWIDGRGGPALVCGELQTLADHVFTTRAWALGSAQSDAELTSGWSEVAAAMGVRSVRLARLRQVHGASVAVKRVGEAAGDGTLPEADIIVSDDPATVIAVQTADCVPMLFADARTGVVAAAHAGWRGLAAGVPGVAVESLARHFGTRASDLVVAMGPSISAASYEVGPDVRREFETRFADRLGGWFPKTTRPGHWLFDGWLAARDQLVAAGVAAANIHTSELCTFTNADTCCSYRRDGRAAGRMAAAIRTRLVVGC